MWAARQTLGAALRTQAPQRFAQRAPAQRLAAALAPTLRFASTAGGDAPVPPDGGEGPDLPTLESHLELLRRRVPATAEQKEARNFVAVVRTISHRDLLTGDGPLLERFEATLAERLEALHWLNRQGISSMVVKSMYAGGYGGQLGATKAAAVAKSMQDKVDWLTRQGISCKALFSNQAVQSTSVTKSMQDKLDWLSRIDGMTSAELEEEAAKQRKSARAAKFLKLLQTPAKKGPAQEKLDWLKRIEGMSREELEEEAKKRQVETDAIYQALRRKLEDKPEEPAGSSA